MVQGAGAAAAGGGDGGSGLPPGGAPLAAPVRERIHFQPHPKTMTMAGEFEYFAAQGRHPFCYALAEFVDNSLRATRRNAPRPRAITVSLVVSGQNPATARGLVVIQDNGCGMNKQELADWAVMNLSMEERGAQPREPAGGGRGGGAGPAGAGRFLTGDLSFFGVGSKNAGFYMGSSIKVATKRADEPYVHELCLAAADLEARYAAREEVYVEDMVHRNPGDASTLAPMERPFAAAHAWVAAEAEAAPVMGSPGGLGGGGAGGAGGAYAGGGPSWTRVVIGDLKPDVLRQLMDDERGAHICQELAHLYHYYLHGEGGNRGGGGGPAGHEGRLPNGEPFPDITLRYQVDARCVWQRRLAEVEDDMETRLLRAQRAELPFTLQVPDKGTVCGVLWYFPFQDGQETVPLENPATTAKPASSPYAPGRATQHAPGFSQLPRATQAAPRATQAPGGAGAAGAGGLEGDDDDEGAGAWQAAPIFEAFWQGRLIPGARIVTLPFLEAVRTKRSAQAKDSIPDEAFRRLRGALFFGPAFRVTRNKLLFRDNLAEVLAGAVPGERQMEAKFRAWLQRCHASLDRSVRFEALADARTQAAVRAKLGEDTTAFERATDGTKTVAAGDVVRVNAKPTLVGRVLHFTVPQVVREEGAYANGRATLELLPPEVYGPGCEKQFSLRRLEAVLGEAEQAEHLAKEMLKVASSLRIEPMRFATGQPLEFAAGDSLPETTAAVLSGGGQRMTKAPFSGERLVVTQRLWRLPPEGGAAGAAPPDGVTAADEEEEPRGRGGKRGRKGRKGRAARQDENAGDNAAAGQASGSGAGAEAAAAATAAGLPPGSELVVCVENRTPVKEAFAFTRISDGLQRAGQYVLEFVATPAPGGQPPLRAAVQLVVAPGPPAAFELSGEGRAAAAVKDFALGEALPPLKLTFSDRFGNPVPPAPTATPPVLTLSVALPGDDGEAAAPCHELAVAAQQAAAGDGLLISRLQLLGSEAAMAGAEGAGGLALFSGGEGGSHPSARQAQAPPSKQALPVAEVLLRVGLGSAPELEPVALPLRVRAGAPRALRLLPGHPWDAPSAGGGAVSLAHGAALPPFQVAAYDAWGNPTAPSPDLGFAVLAECGALGPHALECAVGPLGVATVEGLTGASSTRDSGPALLTLGIKASPANEHTAAAVEAAEPTCTLSLPVAVEPSNRPVALQLVRDGVPLPTREVAGEDGGTTQVAVLEGIEAGSSVSGLRAVLLDESGAPAAGELAGKVTLSWRSGSKKTTWGAAAATATPGIKLPAAKAPESVATVGSEWVRFTATDPPLVLEAALQVQAVPAAPATWTLSLVDQLTSQHSEELGIVQCGHPFALEVEALDGFNNRCGGGGAALPQPALSLEADGPLQYNEQEWERGWVSQGGEQAYSVRLAVAGHPGPLKITVRDSAGPGGASLLSEDTLAVELRAGPPAQLAVEGPGSLEVGTKASLPQLRVRVCDAAGNPTTSETFEVSLNSSALATDGSGRAAAVSASGGNKVKAKKGAAVFRDVRVQADEAGAYALRVQSASRKVAVADAVLHLVMQPLNAVTDLRVRVPEALESGDAPAGTSAALAVEVLTENGRPLPPQAALGALTLKVTPPGGGKSNVVAYSLAAPEGSGEDGGAAGGLATEEGHYAFQLADLTAAGTYSAVAEYAEQRPELAAGLSKKEAALRSATAQFHVVAGQPVALRMEAAALPDKLAVTNGGSAKQRLLLRNAAVQLEDEWGNAAGGGGVQVRCRLRRVGGDGGGDGGGSDVPELAAAGQGAQETDERGRAFLGDLSIAEGSGRASSDALECELVCEALGLYPCPSRELEADAEGWAVCWACPVLFSDDAARFAHIERLNQQRGELAARRDELAQRLGGAAQALEGAHQEQQRAQQALASKERALGPEPPATLKAAKKALAAAQKAAAAAAEAEPEEDAVEARYGNPKSKATAAIDRALRSGDAGLVGVTAQLGTVDDRQLSAVLAAALRGQLGTLVVADAAARQRLAASLAAQKYPAPDMLPMSMLLPYGGKGGDCPGFAGAGERAHALQRAACRGADPPLALPLPHTRAISQLRDKAAGCGIGAADWPRGCLGYAVNLVRPAQPGHRASVLHSCLSGLLVFEGLAEAEQYRELLATRLRTGCCTIVTLDGGRIQANGVVCGSSYSVPPLEAADHRFGSSGLLGENPAAAQAAEHAALLEEWVEMLRARDAADEAAAAAQAEADAAEAQCRGELEAVEGQLAELEAQLALGDMAAGGGAGAASAGKKRGKRQQRQAAQEEEAAEGEEDAEPDAARSGSKGKRRRLQRMRG